MTMTNDVLEQLNYLKLKSAYSYLNSLVMNNEIAEEELHVMHKILNKEVIAKEENNRLYNVKVAAFPFLRKVDDYDFNFQPGIKEEKIRSIIESDFYENATNIVFVGNPGTGKTHLAIAIAYTVAIRRNSVYFIKFNFIYYLICFISLQISSASLFCKVGYIGNDMLFKYAFSVLG